MKQRVGIFSFVGAVAVLTFLNFSCGKGGSATSSGTDSILVNIGTNIIIPGYQSLATSVNSLDSAITDFNASPNSTKLSNVQILFKTAYTAWVSVSQFNYFGPASDNLPPLSGLDKFPADTVTIKNNISGNPGTVNINSYANQSAKGFAALDYLLFDNSAGLINSYTTDANAANRKQYLAIVSTDIKTETDNVLNGWLSSYNTTFMTGTGTSVSSSLGLVINSLDQEVDILKNYRLGVPLGAVLVSTSGTNPTQVEAYYSGISSQLMLTQVKAMEGLYLGTGANGNGLGLSNYVKESSRLYNSYNGVSLDNAITSQFATVIADLQMVPDPLSQTIQTNAAPATKAFTDIQQLLLLLKTDMPSLLAVAITYGDNDGD